MLPAPKIYGENVMKALKLGMLAVAAILSSAAPSIAIAQDDPDVGNYVYVGDGLCAVVIRVFL